MDSGQPLVISRLRPGSGSHTFAGPGRFRLRINSSDGWSVTVRDGA